MSSPLPQGWRSSLLSGGDENTAFHLSLFFWAPTWQGEYLVTQGKGGILGSLLNLYWGMLRGIMQLCSEIFLSFLSLGLPNNLSRIYQKNLELVKAMWIYVTNLQFSSWLGAIVPKAAPFSQLSVKFPFQKCLGLGVGGKEKSWNLKGVSKK